MDIVPICPHCLADPLTIGAMPIQLGNVHALLIFCGSCRKAFNTHVIGVDKPILVPNENLPLHKA